MGKTRSRKTERVKDGYRIKTRKVTFDFKKTADGAYRSQDGTYWQLVPKGVENKQYKWTLAILILTVYKNMPD